MDNKKELLLDFANALSYFNMSFRLTENQDKQLELINYLADLSFKYDEIDVNGYIYDLGNFFSEVCEDLNGCYFERAAYQLLTFRNSLNNE